MKNFIVLLLLALTSSFANASDPSPLQDFCVAIDDPNVFVNGKFCKDPKLAKPEDFFFSGLNVRRSTANKLGTNVTLLNVDRISGLNTLGLSLARIDYAANGGLIPPHAHPRASEILLVLQGTLYVGFVTSNPNNTLMSKILYPGDVFVFPIGLIHFQLNIAKKSRGVAISALSSQNPGTFTIANALFGANPHINPHVLTKAFQLNDAIVEDLQNKFGK